MESITKKIIKVWVFIFFSFVFLNVYFPQKSSAFGPPKRTYSMTKSADTSQTRPGNEKTANTIVLDLNMK